MRTLIFLTVVLSALPAAATRIAPVHATCPSCDAAVVGIDVLATNTHFGRDLDYCPHAQGGHALHHLAWTCTQCLYSGRPDDFYMELSAAQREQISKRLVPLEPLQGDETNFTLAPAIKYDLALQCARILDVSPEFMGMLALDGAWSVRLEYRDHFLDYDVAMRLAGIDATAEQALDPCALDLDAADRLIGRATASPDLQPALRATLAVYAAKLYRLRGEHVPALEAVRAARDWGSGAYDEELATLERGITLERRFFRAALEAYNTALTTDRQVEFKDTYIGTLFFLIAEMHRRLNESGDAARYYRAALAFSKTSPDIRERTRMQLEWLAQTVPLAVPQAGVEDATVEIEVDTQPLQLPEDAVDALRALR